MSSNSSGRGRSMVMLATIGFIRASVPGVATGEETDKSPRVQNRGDASDDGGTDSTKVSAATKPAEVSNLEIANHWFDVAKERLDLPDDLAAVVRTSYREVQVQLPIKLADGEIHV